MFCLVLENYVQMVLWFLCYNHSNKEQSCFLLPSVKRNKVISKLLIMIVFMTTTLFSDVIKVAVAANVSYAIEDLKKEFNRLYPDTKVQVILGSSGKLTAQIKHGAPYDIFMSADMKYPNALYKESVATTKPVVYAQGCLAYFSSKKQDFSGGMKLLQSEKIDKIATANPKTAPYGIAAAEAMKNAKVYESIKKKFVFGESISQTVSYAVSATDIGLIAKSSLFSPKMTRFKEGIHWADVDASLYTPIKQGIVILRKSESEREVMDFYNFVLSEKAQNVFKSFGYLRP